MDLEKMLYPKIQTLYNRDENFKVNIDEFRWKEFEMIQFWDIYEKVDGRNVRLLVEPTKITSGKKSYPSYRMYYGGRKVRSTFSVKEHDCLKDLVSKSVLEEVFIPYIPAQYVIFGELYGVGVQSGGNYRPDLTFKVFDIFVLDEKNVYGGWWLEREDMMELSASLGLDVVPFMGQYTVDDVYDFLIGEPTSIISEMEGGNPEYIMEGVVARSSPMLFTRRGERVMWKLKCKDFER